MAHANFERLRVYRLSEQLADRIWHISIRWSQLARDTVGKQLIKACDSIGANIAEGVGRATYADNRRFVYMARGSLNEVRHWLRRAFTRNLLDEHQVSELRSMIDTLAPMLNAYLKSIGKRSQ